MERKRMKGPTSVACTVHAMLVSMGIAGLVTVSTTIAAPPVLHVDGNKLKDPAGQVVRLEGVNIPSLDWSISGENVLQSIDRATEGWNASIIRIPLTQDLWFGYSKGQSIPDARREEAYRKLVDSVVERIASKNCYVLVDLHWSNGGKWGQNIDQHAMPDEHSVRFWMDCAARYANNPAVFFDLYNEPHDVSWKVWRDGGEVHETNEDPSRGLQLQYRTPGMQALLDAVRSTGARNVVVAGGLDWAYDLRGVVDGYALDDPRGNGVMYGTHLYPWKKDWDRHVTPTALKHPVFVGEVGCNPWKEGDPEYQKVDCATWAPEVLHYMDKHQLTWTAWSFHPTASPCLISDWDYHPTSYWGALVKSAIAK
jgi:hypothetical protein